MHTNILFKNFNNYFQTSKGLTVKEKSITPPHTNPLRPEFGNIFFTVPVTLIKVYTLPAGLFAKSNTTTTTTEH
jgi:hypothetical protein